MIFIDILDKGGGAEVEVAIYYNVERLEKEKVREDYQGIHKSESNTTEHSVLTFFSGAAMTGTAGQKSTDLL